MKKSKNIKNNKKSDAIAGLATIAVVTVVIAMISATYVYSSSSEVTSWITSGPFGINKEQFLGDEKLFFTANGIQPHEKGEIVFQIPDGKEFKVIPFDGSKHSSIKQYFVPVSSDRIYECDSCSMFGTWKILFKNSQGDLYEPITFEVTDQERGGERP